MPQCRAAERAGRRGGWTWEEGHERARVAAVGPGVRSCFVYDVRVARDAESDVGEAPGGVRIYHPGRRRPVQELLIGDASGASPLYLADFDFDGYQDLALASMDNVHNPSYAFHLYVPRTGRYEHWLDQGSLVPDPKRRVLGQYQHGSCCSGSQLTFRVRGRGPAAALVLVEQEDHEPNERRGGTDHVRRTLRRGRMVVVKRWHEADRGTP